MYHYLLVYESGQWCIEFGSYTKKECTFEQGCLVRSGQYKRNLTTVATMPDDKQETIAVHLAVKNNRLSTMVN